MSEKDKKIMENILSAVPKMSEFEKGYFLGMAESKAAEKKDKDNEDSVALDDSE